jgi:ribonuclease T1
MRRKWWWSSVAIALAAALLAGIPAAARDMPAAPREVSVADLPREAGDTLAAIKRGGPFPHRRDGSVFVNRERRLPVMPRGYYTEYTVRTPGRADRGPRRIVAGRGSTGDAATSGEYYYSDDHYETFRRIRE